MAIITNEPVNEQPRQNQAQPQMNQSKGMGTNKVWSFHQKDVVNSPVAAGIGGEYFTKIRTAFTEIYKDLTDQLNVAILSLNRQNFPQLRFSALIVACTMPELDQKTVAYHVLILEATGEKLAPITRQIDNQNIQINRVTSDAFDVVMQSVAREAVAAEFNNHMLYAADAMVIPAHIDASKKEIIENIARNAALACVSVINSATNNYKELNLANMDRECRFFIDVAFGNHQVYDVTGAPQRSSVLITYNSQLKTAKTMQQSMTTVNVADSVARICELSGFLNTIWAPFNNPTGIGFANQVQPGYQPPMQKFAAEFVVTSVRTDYATSPAAVLLALSSFLSLVDNDTWIQALLPRGVNHSGRFQEKIDITDIGALNITANIGNETQYGGFGRAIDIANMKGDLIEINKYLVSIFRPGVVISLDCPEAAPQSWYMSIFAAGATGNQDACMQIYNAANELTNNNFGRHFQAGETMFTNITRVPLGYHMVGEQAQDIRDIDYTAIANLYQNNPQVIHDYSNTFVDRPGVSPMRNLAARENIIKDALRHQCVINGYAARVTLADKFIKALSAAIQECNLPVQVNTPLNADQLRSGTPSPSFINSSLAYGTTTYKNSYMM